MQIHFRNDAVGELYRAAGVQTTGSAGFDLICVEDVHFEVQGQFQLIDLGVVIKVPEGCHSILMPRSSTFKKFKILQTNGVGLIDEDYSGPEDFWMMPALYMGHGPSKIPRGSRICQFILQKTLQIQSVNEFQPDGETRGGFGSTGV